MCCVDSGTDMKLMMGVCWVNTVCGAINTGRGPGGTGIMGVCGVCWGPGAESNSSRLFRS